MLTPATRAMWFVVAAWKPRFATTRSVASTRIVTVSSARFWRGFLLGTVRAARGIGERDERRGDEIEQALATGCCR
jgi:hypothetical protein